MKLTGWYRGDQKPVRVGPYLRRYPERQYYTWWDGEKWVGGAWFNAERCALRHHKLFEFDQSLPWCGVVK